MPSHNARHEPSAEEVFQNEENRSRASDEGSHKSGAESGEAVEGTTVSKHAPKAPHPIMGLIIFTVLQFVALLFMTIATPIEMFTLNDTWRDTVFPGLAGTSKTMCVTAWGLKSGCRSTSYYTRDFVNNFCFRVRTNFRVVEAFCIMTIAFMCFALVLSVFSIFHKVSKGSTGAMGVFAATLGIIPWGIVAGMYWQSPCCETTDWFLSNQTTQCNFAPTSPAAALSVPPFKEMGKYGAAFGLMVTAWCLQVIGCVFAFVPI